MTARPHLSIVVPAYNEEPRLGPTLERLVAWAADAAFGTEIIVVDDGSTDNTINLARSFDVVVIESPGNRGKGHAVGTGVSRAQGELILFSDADLSTPIEEFSRLRDAMDGADIAIGSRGKKESDLKKRQPFFREYMGRTFNLFVQTMVFPGISDTQCGFKLFTSDAAKRVFAHRTIDGFAFDVEILYVAQRLGLRIAEIPIIWINDEASTVHPIRDSLRMLRDIAKVRRNHRDVSG